MTAQNLTPRAIRTIERIAEAVLGHHQATTDDLAVETGLSQATLLRYIHQLELQNRVHRVHGIGKGAPGGGIWAPGAAPMDEGEPTHEPIHLTVRNWRAGPSYLSQVEAFFFGRTSIDRMVVT